MKYYELTCSAYLKQDISFKESFETLAKYINYSLVKSGLDLHYNKANKHYTFSNFKLKVVNPIYKAKQHLNFTIRSFDIKVIKALEETLRTNINNPFLLVIQTSRKEVKQYFINKLYSLNPVIVSVDSGRFWTRQERVGRDFLKFELENNLKKKYESFYGEKLELKEDFISELEQLNDKPQNIQIRKNDKIIRFFGNKFTIIPNNDEVSQKLAFTALACGLGEKNSYGAGFCLGK